MRFIDLIANYIDPGLSWEKISSRSSASLFVWSLNVFVLLIVYLLPAFIIWVIDILTYDTFGWHPWKAVYFLIFVTLNFSEHGFLRESELSFKVKIHLWIRAIVKTAVGVLIYLFVDSLFT